LRGANANGWRFEFLPPEKMSIAKLTKNQIFTAICLALALVTLAVYWPITRDGFVNFDDDVYIVANPHVTSGLTWTNVAWAFTSGEGGNWHPLTWLSHMVDCQLFGLNPGGHHLVSILFHIANTLLLFLLLNQMTGALWRSAFVAALFAWHPLHVESVAWASERKDVLSTFFWLLTLMAYARFAELSKVQSSKSKVFYALALIFFACGLMSKPMVVTLPFVLLLLDFWPLNRFQNFTGANLPRRAAVLTAEKIPFFLLASAASAVTYAVQKSGGAFWPEPFGTRFANAALAYVRYISKIFWPADLAVVYSYPHQWPVALVIFAVAMLATWSGLLIFWSRRHPYLAVGWLWFLGTLVPTIGLVQVGAQSIADRYTYIPSIGFFIVAAWGLNDILNRKPERKKIAALIGVVALAGCLAATSIQINYWRNSLALFSHAVTVSTDNYVADNCLGKALEKNGDNADALALYTEAVRIEPRYFPAQFNLATSLLEFGRDAAALGHLETAVALQPGFADAQYDLGLFFLQHGQLEKARIHLISALEHRPDFPEAKSALAQILAARPDLKTREALDRGR
jgi:hypothetical protein